MNKTCILMTLFLGCAALTAHAAGDAAMGQAKSYACTACHGADGLKQAPGQPTLGGRPTETLMAAMHDIRAGRRLHPYMQILLLTMSEQDMADIASHFAGVDPRKASPSSNPYLR